MRSIRLYLLLALLATMTLVNFVSLLHGYQSSMSQAEALFDSRLRTTALVIASATGEQMTRPVGMERKMPYTFYQIWNDDGSVLLTRSHNAPATATATGPLDEGFHDINHASYRWRNFIYHDRLLNRWIVVAERVDIRYMLAEEVVMASLLPIVMAIPVAALIIWFAVGVGLRPLREFADQIHRRRADDLSPIALTYVPKELRTVLRNTNDLLARLQAAFSREQHFSADAAHELRTPVSILKVHLHNLQQRLGDKDEDLSLLGEAVDRMNHLIEQILALYRTSPEQAVQQFQSVDLYQLAQDMMAREYPMFEKKRQHIALEGETVHMQGNPFALETLLHNLLGNASKYTPENGKIRVELRETKTGCLLRIEDSGPGIPAALHARVFERFYRLHGDRHDSDVVGCGLGLTIVRHIVELHHGSISLGTSRYRSGLKVEVHFPHDRQES